MNLCTITRTCTEGAVQCSAAYVPPAVKTYQPTK